MLVMQQLTRSTDAPSFCRRLAPSSVVIAWIIYQETIRGELRLSLTYRVTGLAEWKWADVYAVLCWELVTEQ